MKNILIILLFITSANFANAEKYNYYPSWLHPFANKYYVANAGSDGAAGTSSGTAWQTLNKIFTHGLSAGDTVFLNRGDSWNEQLKIPNSGSAGNLIVFASYGTGANPIVTGLTSVSAWTNTSGNIWESTSAITSSSNMLNIVTVNGNFQAIGRYPKVNASTTSWSSGGWYQFQSHSGTTSVTSNQIASAPDFTGGQVVLRTTHWLINKGTISAQTGTVVTYSPISTFTVSSVYAPKDNFGFFFQNHANACTAQNEWYYNTSTKKIGIYSVGTPSGVKVATVDTLVNVNGKNYITFYGIDFTGANAFGFLVTGSSHVTIQNCNISYCGVDGISSRSSAASYISVLNSTISYCNNGGIFDRFSPNWTIQNSTFSNIGMTAGMGVSCDGSNYSGTAGIGDNSSITYCEVYNIGLSGINFSITHGNTISILYTYVHDFCEVADDGAGIGCNGAPGIKTIQNNIVLNSPAASNGTSDGLGGGQANGIYIDDNSPNGDISNNTVSGCNGVGFYLHGSGYFNISGNTSYANTLGQAQFVEISSDSLIRGLTMNNNIFFATADTQAIAYFKTDAADITSFGTFDNNFYCFPLQSNPAQIHYNNGSGSNWVTLSGWQSFSDQDANSKKSPKTVTSVDSLLFQYNASNQTNTKSLGGTYEDVVPNIYSGFIPLSSYASAVLLYNGVYIPTNRIRVSGIGRVIKLKQ